MDIFQIMKEFVQNIVIFSVLSAFCIHLLPDQRYQRYARFAIGLVYVCMIMDVVYTLFGGTVPVISF